MAELLQELESKQKFDEYLDNIDNEYYNGESKISDDQYDALIDTYNSKFGQRNKVGHSPDKKLTLTKIILPYFMGSLKKVKTEKALGLWMKKYKSPYTLSDKIDGVSVGMTIFDKVIKLYKRGDGNTGTDITHLCQFLDIPKIDKNIMMRGEIVIEKKVFEEKYSNTSSNARNLVSGATGAKEINEEMIRDLKVVFYRIIPFGDFPKEMKHSEQISILKQLYVNVPEFFSISNVIDCKSLTDLINDRKKHGSYNLDGVVIISDYSFEYPKDDDPKHAIAFKILSETAETEVEFVEWNVSKNSYMKPRIKVKEVDICGVKINWTTGFNAKFISDNKIGRGSRVLLTRSGDVIPYIVEVLSHSFRPDLPEGDTWKWLNDTDIVLKNPEKDPDFAIKKIIFFFKTMNAKYLGDKLIKKLVENKFDTLEKILTITEKDLVKLSLIKKKSAERILSEIKKSISDVDLISLMTASGIFGNGLGEKKIKKIIDKYPDILDNTPDEIHVDGIKTASQQFLGNITMFNKFLKDHPMITVKKEKQLHAKTEKKKFSDMNIVFTGFRDRDLEKIIENNGGIMKTAVSKKTTFVITKDKNIISTKLTTARNFDIPIFELDEFKKSLNCK